ncbi:MAG: DUF424 family protein [Promethearchaeota archaeon]
MPDQVYLKIHRSGASEVIAVCDPHLLGKCIKDSKHILTISERFYEGMLVSRDEALDYIRQAHNVNLVGSIITSLVEQNVLRKDSILWIDDEDTGQRVPHVIIFRV